MAQSYKDFEIIARDDGSSNDIKLGEFTQKIQMEK